MNNFDKQKQSIPIDGTTLAYSIAARILQERSNARVLVIHGLIPIAVHQIMGAPSSNEAERKSQLAFRIADAMLAEAEKFEI